MCGLKELCLLYIRYGGMMPLSCAGTRKPAEFLESSAAIMRVVRTVSRTLNGPRIIHGYLGTIRFKLKYVCNIFARS